MRYLILFLTFVSLIVYAEPYKWVDANGRTYYSDKMPDDDSEIIEIKGYVNTYTPVDLSDVEFYKRPEEAPKPKRITKKGEVILFTIDRCGYCRRAKEYFRLNNIVYKEMNIQHSKKAKELFVTAGGRGGVPFTVIWKPLKEIKIAGFSEPRFDAVFRPSD